MKASVIMAGVSAKNSNDSLEEPSHWLQFTEMGGESGALIHLGRDPQMVEDRLEQIEQAIDAVRHLVVSTRRRITEDEFVAEVKRFENELMGLDRILTTPKTEIK